MIAPSELAYRTGAWLAYRFVMTGDRLDGWRWRLLPLAGVHAFWEKEHWQMWREGKRRNS